MLYNFYRLDLYNKTRVALANLHCKNQWKLALPYFCYGYRKRMFVDFLIGYMLPSNCVHYWMQSG